MKIKTLKIANFRQFEKKEIKFEKNWTIILAPNARGKSTIVESISLLANGTSPWTTNNSTMIRIPPQNGETQTNAYTELKNGTFRIESQVETEDELKTISIFVQNKNGALTKQFQIEGHSTTRNKFTDTLHCILFSPDMIDLLMFEPRQRRDFLDTHISQINPDYSHILSNYSKVLRQRNSLLKIIAARRYRNNYNGNSSRIHNGNNSDVNGSYNKNGTPDKSGLTYWTEQLLDLGAKVIQARFKFIDTINSAKSDLYQTTISYIPRVKFPDLAELASDSYIYDSFQKQLSASKPKESVIGNTMVGPHRDDWYLCSKEEQNLNIYGSRGEKRMAIADIIFKINDYLTQHIGEIPVMLLDDISSELDSQNIKKLFDKKIGQNQQTIITTTSLDNIPAKALKLSQIIKL